MSEPIASGNPADAGTPATPDGASSRGASDAREGSASIPPAVQPDDLHNLFAGSDGAEEADPLAALREDPNYGELIRELEYIAEQARLLFLPADENPSEKVWTNIQHELGQKLPDA